LRAVLTRLSLLTVLLVLFLAAPAGAVIVPRKGMAGATLGQCIEDVIKVVGTPDKTFGKTEPTGEFFTSKGKERTAEGVGKGTMHKTLKAKRKHVKCQTFHVGRRRIRSCHIGKFTPAKPVTEFRIDSKGRVSTVSVRIVSD
jgi:hypothetical protein